MKINSRILGEIDVDDANLIYFAEGIPAYEKEKELFIIPLEQNGPFYYIHSCKSNFCLLMADPFFFFTDYEVNLTEPHLQELGCEEGRQEDIAVYTIMTVADDFKQTTVNLLAPVIINFKTRRGLQLVPQKSNYSTRQLLFNIQPPPVQQLVQEGR